MGVVVVGIDGSEQSIGALHFAVLEANLRAVPLRVVHAFAIPITGPFSAGVTVDPEPFEQGAHRLVDAVLAEVGSDLEGIEIERVVELGPSASVIIEHASSDDVVVVGSRGRGGFKGLLLGSVSQQVALHAPCPVVVVPATVD